MASTRRQAGQAAVLKSKASRSLMAAGASLAQQARANADRDRREHRRHDLEQLNINIDRWDGFRRGGTVFGQIVDISAGGVRIRTTERNLRPDHQIRVRLELPAYAGICPFIDTSSGRDPEPKHEWVGWMAVCRVTPLEDGEYEIAGRLLDMEEMDRGMLGLYLSTQPLAA
jgi:hypothetical protein